MNFAKVVGVRLKDVRDAVGLIIAFNVPHRSCWRTIAVLLVLLFFLLVLHAQTQLFAFLAFHPFIQRMVHAYLAPLHSPIAHLAIPLLALSALPDFYLKTTPAIGVFLTFLTASYAANLLFVHNAWEDIVCQKVVPVASVAAH